MSKRPRRQLNTEQKEEFRKRIRENGSDARLHELVGEWNSRHKEHSCPIDFGCLKRIRASMPISPESIWEKVKTDVEAETARTDAFQQYELPEEGYDYDGKKTPPVDADKIPWATESQMESVRL